MEERAILKLLGEMVKPYHPEIDSFDVIYDTRNGLCEIIVYVDGTEYEQEEEIEHDIITGLTNFFKPGRRAIEIWLRKFSKKQGEKYYKNNNKTAHKSHTMIMNRWPK